MNMVLFIKSLYNQLVCSLKREEATFLTCRKLLRAFSTTSYLETFKNTQGNDLGHSDNEKDWTICSQAPKLVKARVWRRFRDYNGMGLRILAKFDEDLRNSPSLFERIELQKYLIKNILPVLSMGRLSIQQLNVLPRFFVVQNIYIYFQFHLFIIFI
jgi:hypothetical protein